MDDLWTIERRLWLDGADAYAELMAPHCLMAFGPMGVLEDTAIVDSLREAPRWSDVAISGQVTITPADNVAVLAYRAEGRRTGAANYHALCTSTYVKLGGAWRIAQHQQTPLD